MTTPTRHTFAPTFPTYVSTHRPLLDFGIIQNAEAQGRPRSALVSTRGAGLSAEETMRRRARVKAEDQEQLESLVRENAEGSWYPHVARPPEQVLALDQF